MGYNSSWLIIWKGIINEVGGFVVLPLLKISFHRSRLIDCVSIAMSVEESSHSADASSCTDRVCARGDEEIKSRHVLRVLIM